MVSDPAAVLRIAPREHLSRLTCRFALRMRPLRIEFDHVSVVSPASAASMRRDT